jgi:hypothetical protein
MAIEVGASAGGVNEGPGGIAYRSVQVFPVEVATDIYVRVLSCDVARYDLPFAATHAT